MDLGPDPNAWPIIGSVYRYTDDYGDGHVIYTASRYECHQGYMLVRRESDHHCHRCGTSMMGGFGIITYTRKENSTIPMYICVGCIGRECHDRPLIWRDETMEELVEKIPSTARNSPELLDIVNEIYITMRLRELGQHPDRMVVPNGFATLVRFAKKL